MLVISLSMRNKEFELHDTFVHLCSDSLLLSIILPVDLFYSLENPVRDAFVDAVSFITART